MFITYKYIKGFLQSIRYQS